LSGLLETLRRFTGLLDRNHVEYMVIGGYALPFYGRIRTTLDLDVAVAVEDDEFRGLCSRAEEEGYQVSLASPLNPYCIYLDTVTGFEVEVWRRPDGIRWDQETLRRRRRFSVDGLGLWVVSPEDFIVTKLARPDRAAQDEMDVKSVLERSGVELDWRYLRSRAEDVQVWGILQAIHDSTL
jgi:predicted nucleotidyltransferase